jgi:hypothetical protein
MSVQVTANNQSFRVDSGALLPRAFTVTCKIKLDDTAVAGTVLSLVSDNFKLYRVRWSGATWQFINSDSSLTSIGGTGTTAQWVSVAMRISTTPVSGGDITRVDTFVRNDGGVTFTASGTTEQFMDTVGRIFIGNLVDYSPAGQNNARFKAADLKAWSVVLSQADIETEWDQQAPSRTADRVVINYFDGGSIEAAAASDYAVAAWAATWDRIDNDGSIKSFPVYSAESPSYGGGTARTLTGTDTLPSAQ